MNRPCGTHKSYEKNCASVLDVFIHLHFSDQKFKLKFLLDQNWALNFSMANIIKE